MEFSLRRVIGKLITDYQDYCRSDKKIPFGVKFFRRKGASYIGLVRNFPDYLQRNMRLDFRPKWISYYRALEIIWEKDLVPDREKEVFQAALLEIRKNWRVETPKTESDRLIDKKSLIALNEWLELQSHQNVVEEKIADRIVNRVDKVNGQDYGSWEILLLIWP